MPRFNRLVHISEPVGRIALKIARQRQGFVGIAMGGGAAQIIRHAPKPVAEIEQRSFDGDAGADRIHADSVTGTGDATNGG